MTAYLQRLFDRAGGLAARPATALSPTFSSRSPVAEADQRLNVPDLAASLFSLPPMFDAPSRSDDEALAGFEDAPARPAPRRGLPPARTTETLIPLLAEPPIATPPEPPPLLPQRTAAPRPQRPVLPDRPVLAPARESREAVNITVADTPPRAVPRQPVEPAASREPPQPRQAEIAATPLEPSPMPSVATTEGRVVTHLEPVPLPAPEPLPAPAPAPPPRDVAELRQPTVTRREIVAAPAPEPVAQPPSRTMPATAESVSRIGKLTPRRRAQLVFGLRRR